MNRITYLYTARSWAILLVVLGYAIQYTVPNFDEHLTLISALALT